MNEYVQLVKNFDFKRIIEKKFYERCFYESVDNKGLS